MGGGCFTWLLLLTGSVLVMVSLLRWFEQTTEAVDRGWWNKVTLLVAFPFGVWFFPSRVAAGRPTPVPHHEPVRGFGGLPKGGIQEPIVTDSASPVAPAPAASAPAASTPATDAPPPGTPKEFLGLPKIPPKPPQRKAVDPEKLAKLRQKMKDQGMLDE